MPPKMPFIDESKLFKAIIEFRSGTPAMTLTATQLRITPDLLILESEADGKVMPGIEVRRSSVSRMTVEFDSAAAEE